MKTITTILGAALLTSLTACNQSQNSGGQTTPEGTTVTNRVNSDMEQHRSPSGVDSTVSPGSNAYDLNTDNSGATGIDDNMRNQDDTHGRSTLSGDNGSGNSGSR